MDNFESQLEARYLEYALVASLTFQSRNFYSFLFFLLHRISNISAFPRFFATLIFAVMSQKHCSVLVEISTNRTLNFLIWRMDGEDMPYSRIFSICRIVLAEGAIISLAGRSSISTKFTYFHILHGKLCNNEKRYRYLNDIWTVFATILTTSGYLTTYKSDL